MNTIKSLQMARGQQTIVIIILYYVWTTNGFKNKKLELPKKCLNPVSKQELIQHFVIKKQCHQQVL